MSMTASPAPTQDPGTAVAERAPALPDAVAKRGLDEAQWRTLMGSLFPGARPESVLMVVDYCRARRLDPMKKPCHIVPMRVKDAKTNEWGWRDVVMPGIYEYRTTAMRTGQYAGRSQPEYGPMLEFAGVTAPEWCAMTIYRRQGHERIEFPVRVYFRESAQTKQDGKANDRWSKAPIQMLTKVCEAAGLREAFPDEFGGEMTAEEMDGQVLALDEKPVVQQPQRKSEPPAATPSTPVVDVALTPKVEAPAVTEPGVTIRLERRQPASGPAFWIVRTSDQRILLRPEDGDGWAEIVQALQRADQEQRAVFLTPAAVEGQKYPNVIEVAFTAEAAS